MRSIKEIEDVANKAAEREMEGSKWPGTSYENGVTAALRWVLCDEEPDPMEG